LVKNQSTASQNGIYLCASGAWTRASDADSDAEVTAGMFTFIEEGTANADTGWVLSSNQPITVGTSSLTFTQFSGTGAGVPANYAGQNTITTLGTVTTGTWNASVVSPTYGGTGLSSVLNGLVKGNGSAYSVAVADTDYLTPSSDLDGGTF
jgi:phage-related tail fiber protein